MMYGLSVATLIGLLFLQKAGLSFASTHLEKDHSDRFAFTLIFCLGHNLKEGLFFFSFEHFACSYYQVTVC